MDVSMLVIASPLIIVAIAAIFIVLERLKPYDPHQILFREGFWTDLLWYTIIQSYILKIVIVDGIIPAIDGAGGFSHHRMIAHWPMWGQVAFFFITHDFYIYWFHRWQHHSRILWRIHEAHHSVRDVDWLAGSRSHAFEIIINQTVEFLPIYLLGAAPEVFFLKGLVDAGWGMYIHSNIDVHSGFLQYVINGPEMHRWHHARSITEGGINFGTKLAIWDWMFGTAILPRQKPDGYGLEGIKFPTNYFAQHTFAFRPFEPEGP